MQKTKRSRITHGMCRVFGVLWLALLMFAVAALAANPPDWTVGDIFVATGNGGYQVYHSANPGAPNPSYTLLQTFSDGLGGKTAGCAFDSAYRLFGTNFDYAKVDQYSIDFGHGVGSQITTAVPNPESAVFDNKGNLFVGHGNSPTPGNGTIEEWHRDADPQSPTFGTYQPVTSFTVAVENRGTDWIDLASDPVTGVITIYYTSEGRKIFTFNTGNNAAGIFADLGQPGLPNYTLFALRILSNGDVLVADKKNIKRVKLGGTVVKTYDASGQDDWEVLSLDPNGGSFWAGDATTHKFYRFNIATGAVEAGPYSTNASLGGICVYGGFSQAQPAPSSPQTAILSLSAATPTATTVFTTGDGSKLTASLIYDPTSGPVNVKLTLRSTFVHPSVGLSDPTVFGIYAGNNIQTQVPGNMPCVQNSNPSSTNFGLCEVFELEANENSGFLPSNYYLTLGSDFPCSSSAPGSTFPCSNPRIVRNLNEDVTSSIDCCSTKTIKCIFTINQQTTPKASVCPGFSPATGSIFSRGQSAVFKFQAVAGDTSLCKNGPFLLTLDPLLLLVQVPPTGTITPAPTAFFVDIKGNSGGPPIFTLGGTNSNGNNTTYQLQVNTTNLPPGTYFWTVIDLGCTSSTGCTTIPAFGTTFTIQ
jgi:hypothetical protein